MSAGLIGVFVADMRSRQVRDVKLFAQAVTFIAVFYDGPRRSWCALAARERDLAHRLVSRRLGIPQCSLAGRYGGPVRPRVHRRQHYYPAIFHEIAALGTSGGRDRANDPRTGPSACRAACVVHALPRHPNLAGDRLSRRATPE
jgi:hypothetical protein